MPEMVGGGAVWAAETTMEKAAREALCVPSLTDMVMFESVPASALEGVPVSAPVVLLNEAQEGLLLIMKVSVPPLGSEVVGVKE